MGGGLGSTFDLMPTSLSARFVRRRNRRLARFDRVDARRDRRTGRRASRAANRRHLDVYSNVRYARRLLPRHRRLSNRLNLSDPLVRMRIGLLMTGLIIIGGTIAYTAIGLSFLDALYHTVVTISTVGYGEPAREHLHEAVYEIFTMGLILIGTGTLLYTLGMLVEGILDRRLNDRFRRRRMRTAMSGLNGHTIVCGYGQVGQAITQGLVDHECQVVVIDRRAITDELPVLFWEAEATDDQTLADVNLDHAAALVLALDSDVDNLYVTLSARARRPDLWIIARANTPSSAPKLERAGADRVVNPHEIGGARMAVIATHPGVADYMETAAGHVAGASLHTYVIPPDGPLPGVKLASLNIRGRWGVATLAVRRDGEWVNDPPPDFTLSPGDALALLGTTEQLSRAVDNLE